MDEVGLTQNPKDIYNHVVGVLERNKVGALITSLDFRSPLIALEEVHSSLIRREAHNISVQSSLKVDLIAESLEFSRARPSITLTKREIVWLDPEFLPLGHLLGLQRICNDEVAKAAISLSGGHAGSAQIILMALDEVQWANRTVEDVIARCERRSKNVRNTAFAFLVPALLPAAVPLSSTWCSHSSVEESIRSGVLLNTLPEDAVIGNVIPIISLLDLYNGDGGDLANRLPGQSAQLVHRLVRHLVHGSPGNGGDVFESVHALWLQLQCILRVNCCDDNALPLVAKITGKRCFYRDAVLLCGQPVHVSFAKTADDIVVVGELMSTASRTQWKLHHQEGTIDRIGPGQVVTCFPGNNNAGFDLALIHNVAVAKKRRRHNVPLLHLELTELKFSGHDASTSLDARTIVNKVSTCDTFLTKVFAEKKHPFYKSGIKSKSQASAAVVAAYSACMANCKVIGDSGGCRLPKRTEETSG